MKISDAKCRVCGKGVVDGHAVYRQKDDKGGWACELHNETPVDEGLKELIATIESDNQTKQ